MFGNPYIKKAEKIEKELEKMKDEIFSGLETMEKDNKKLNKSIEKQQKKNINK